MTIDEKKQVLREYILMDERISRLIRERDRWHRVAGRISPSMSGMPGGQNRDRISEAVANIADIEDEICRRVEQLHSMRVAIETAIDALPDRTQRSILQLRYIGGAGWDYIADAVGYSRRQMFYIYKKALQNLNLDEHCTNCTAQSDNMIA